MTDSYQNLNIGVAQIQRKPGELKQNFEQHIEYIEKANHEKLDILLFPELSLTGYGSSDQIRKASLNKDDKRINLLCQLAPKSMISIGIAEQQGNNLYNTSLMLFNGKIHAIYRKMNLPQYGRLYEKDWATAGNELSLIEFKQNKRILKIHQLICADIWNPAIAHCAMIDKPDVLLTSICSMQTAVSDDFKNSLEWPKVLSCFSMIYTTPIAMANYIDCEGFSGCWGGSLILDAHGNELVNAYTNEGIFSAEVKIQHTSQARERLPTLRDCDNSLILKLIGQRFEK